MKMPKLRAARRLSARPVSLGSGKKAVGSLFLGATLVMTLFIPEATWAVNFAAPPSLKTVPVPEPNNLGEFLKSDPTNLNPDGYPIPNPEAKRAAIALGKALFWDMKVGSDDTQACATCHSHAGADNRTKNTVSPGLKMGDSTFQAVIGPNATLTPGMFPFHTLTDPNDRLSPVLSDKNDVVSSQGVHKTDYVSLAGASEVGKVSPDSVFNVGGLNVRRVEPRNTPTVINAVFNFSNFWDGRANNIFNGVNPFGDADPNARIHVDVNGALQTQRVRIPMASLASQAVGPPGSDFEMSYAGRTFSTIGKKLMAKTGQKLIPLAPLSKQTVHPKDSVLGLIANKSGKGLTTTYADMIRAAFQDKYYSSSQTIDLGTPQSPQVFTQMEANFSLFFGLAIQMYESTLISNDSPFDRFQEGNSTAMSASAQSGLNMFLAQNEAGAAGGIGGNCINCHGGSEFTNASVSHVGATNFGASLPEALLELMTMGDGRGSFYDAGYYDIGVRPIAEDPGRGDKDPYGYPLSFTDRALLIDPATGTSATGLLQSLFPDIPVFNPFLPCGRAGFPPTCPDANRSATLGSFKTPTLRNIELTGPYFHNGGQATLMQVMDFYSRGGDFHEQNFATLDPDIETLVGLNNNDAAQRQLIDFLMALTDDRVRWEKAPFDHPELYVPNGATGDTTKVRSCGTPGEACDTLVKISAVGAGGLAAEKLPALKTFLGMDPYQP
ncbi:MAG: cytochrome-c peroxidase [Methylobacter sp.]